jgi:glucose 1-dehydrogenase
MREAVRRLNDNGRIVNISSGLVVRPTVGYGLYVGSKGAVERMGKVLSIELGDRGKIINVTSIHEEVVTSNTADYCASKGGLRSLSWTLALELAEDGINVNNLAPGMVVLTPINQQAIDDPKLRRKMEQSIPMKRAAQPKEVAKLALFLASADSDYVTGSTYVVDGEFMRAEAQGA